MRILGVDHRPAADSHAAKTYDSITAALRLRGHNNITPQLIASQSIADELHNATEQSRLPATERELNRLVTSHPPLIRIKDRVRACAPRNEPVLITGESGTGKELIARAIHGHREDISSGPFVQQNCGGITETLAPALFFGHKRGTFTGALEDRRGLLEEAAGGTIFLDEIGALPASLQALLLRAIQEGEIYPVGAVKPVAIFCRFVAATSRNIKQMVADGQFLPDLYYRLSIFRFHIPPMSARTADIPLIAKAMGYNAPIPDEAIPWICREGNVRGIQKFIARMTTFGDWKDEDNDT
jgi:transcriptional regulator with PAS, ATPase and Fis domain